MAGPNSQIRSAPAVRRHRCAPAAGSSSRVCSAAGVVLADLEERHAAPGARGPRAPPVDTITDRPPLLTVTTRRERSWQERGRRLDRAHDRAKIARRAGQPRSESHLPSTVRESAPIDPVHRHTQPSASTPRRRIGATSTPRNTHAAAPYLGRQPCGAAAEAVWHHVIAGAEAPQSSRHGHATRPPSTSTRPGLRRTPNGGMPPHKPRHN
jgi:hypothetical protein